MKSLKRISIIASFCFIFTMAFSNYGKADINEHDLQKEIADKIIRFHVIANSDSNEDQKLKYEVRDYIADYMGDILEEADSVEEAREIVNNNIEEIRSKAKQYVNQSRKNYDVSAVLEETYFPVKTYGNFTFPSGEYEALRIVIGEGKGQNWWCVLYPDLCFVDESYGVVEEESESMLKKNLSEDAYNMLTASSKGKLKIRFGIIDKLIFYLNI